MVEVNNNNNSEWENAMREIMTQDDSLPSSNVNNVNVPINIDLSDFVRETQTKDNDLKKEISDLKEKLNNCKNVSNIDQQKEIGKLISEKEEIRKDFEIKLKETQNDNQSQKEEIQRKLESEMEKMGKEISDLEEELSVCKNTPNREQEKEIENLISEKEEIRKDFEKKLESEMEKMGKEISDLEEELSTCKNTQDKEQEKEIENLISEKEEIRKDFERKLESEMEKMGKEISGLEEKLNVCKNTPNKEQENEIENLISEKEEIRKDFERELKSEKDRSKLDLESQKNVFDIKIDDLLNKNKDLELSNNLKMKEIETLTTTEIGESEKLDSLQRQIDTGKKIIEENNETIENLKRENQSLEVEKIQISNDLSKCSSKTKDLDSRIENLIQEIENNSLSESSLKNEISSLEEQLEGQKEKLNNEFNELTAQKLSLNERINELSNEKQSLEFEKTELLSKITLGENNLRRANNLQANTLEDLRACSNKIEELKNKNSSDNETEINSLKKELSELESLMGIRTTEAIKLRDDLKEKTEFYEKELKESKEENDRLSIVIEGLKEENKILEVQEEKLNKCVSDLEESKNLNIKNEEEISTLKKEIENLNKDKDNSQTKIRELEESIKSKDGELTTLNSENDEKLSLLQEEKDLVDRTLFELEKVTDDSKDENKKILEDVRLQLEEEIEKLRKCKEENAALRISLERVQNVLKDEHNKVIEQDIQIKKKESRLQQLNRIVGIKEDEDISVFLEKTKRALDVISNMDVVKTEIESVSNVFNIAGRMVNIIDKRLIEQNESITQLSDENTQINKRLSKKTNENVQNNIQIIELKNKINQVEESKLEINSKLAISKARIEALESEIRISPADESLARENSIRIEQLTSINESLEDSLKREQEKIDDLNREMIRNNELGDRLEKETKKLAKNLENFEILWGNLGNLSKLLEFTNEPDLKPLTIFDSGEFNNILGLQQIGILTLQTIKRDLENEDFIDIQVSVSDNIEESNKAIFMLGEYFKERVIFYKEADSYMTRNSNVESIIYRFKDNTEEELDHLNIKNRLEYSQKVESSMFTSLELDVTRTKFHDVFEESSIISILPERGVKREISVNAEDSDRPAKQNRNISLYSPSWFR